MNYELRITPYPWLVFVGRPMPPALAGRPQEGIEYAAYAILNAHVIAQVGRN